MTIEVTKVSAITLATRPRGQVAMAWNEFRRNKLAVMGAIIILALILSSILAPAITPHDPSVLDLKKRFAPPGAQGFLLGSDELGRDLLSRLLYAGRISLFIGFAAMAITVVVGAPAGLIAAYFGGTIDTLTMRFTDVVMSFPTLFLLLVLASFIGSTITSIALIVGLTAWMYNARIVYSQTLSLKEQDFVLAARAIGASDWRIILRHLMPNTVGLVVVAAAFNIVNAILAESYISYLGYGIQPPTASWGSMLNNAQSYFNTAPWLAIIPGLAITVTVTSFAFLGNGLRDALDPWQRAR